MISDLYLTFLFSPPITSIFRLTLMTHYRESSCTLCINMICKQSSLTSSLIPIKTKTENRLTRPTFLLLFLIYFWYIFVIHYTTEVSKWWIRYGIIVTRCPTFIFGDHVFPRVCSSSCSCRYKRSIQWDKHNNELGIVAVRIDESSVYNYMPWAPVTWNKKDHLKQFAIG